MRGVPPLQVSFGQLAGATLMLVPFGLSQLPSSSPSLEVWLSVVALGVLGSGVAYLLYFAIIASAGASRAILVTYLVPAFALIYGAVLLDEAITAVSLVGVTLVLAGTALATGLRRSLPSGGDPQVLAAPPHPRRPLGRLVLVHQGRCGRRPLRPRSWPRARSWQESSCSPI